MATTTRSWWGWGTAEDAVRGSELDALLRRVRELLPDADLTPTTAPAVSDLGLPTPRVAAPRALAPLCSHEPTDRAAHTHGKAFRDVVRNLAETSVPHPTLWCGREPSRTSSTCSTGAPAPTSP